MKCDQCESLYINGVFCHETGCPNTKKVYNKEDDVWEKPEPEYDEDDLDGVFEDDDESEDDQEDNPDAYIDQALMDHYEDQTHLDD